MKIRHCFLCTLLSVLLLLSLAGCGHKALPENVAIKDLDSQLFTQQELMDAVQLLYDDWNPNEWGELQSVQYLGDDVSQQELDYCNNLPHKRADFTQCAVFRVQFHTPAQGTITLNPDYDCTWTWTFARTDHSPWKMISYGAA